MITKSTIKLIRSLDTRKGRQKEGLFVAEGPKAAGDIMKHMRPELIVATREWLDGSLPPDMAADPTLRIAEATDDELRRASLLMHPQQVIALFRIPTLTESPAPRPDCLCIALDGVQDPGNLGTIIRVADWFGIRDVICSRDTADAYNPKVVQATMGSIARVSVTYTDLAAMLDGLGGTVPVYGTLLDGENIYTQQLSPGGIIVMGNEGKGISQQIRSRITRKLLIPGFGSGDTAESLNVAIATAITCSEFRRRLLI